MTDARDLYLESSSNRALPRYNYSSRAKPVRKTRGNIDGRVGIVLNMPSQFLMSMQTILSHRFDESRIPQVIMTATHGFLYTHIIVQLHMHVGEVYCNE